jgi:phosphoribosylformylglycinamidine synthase
MGRRRNHSLFQLIKRTTQYQPQSHVVSAYKDNCSFARADRSVEQFAPSGTQDKPLITFRVRDIETVLSLKAETHNFPTTVEPFNGASTGTGWRNPRPHCGGGRAAIPMAGTAVYMTSYPRLGEGTRNGRLSSGGHGPGSTRPPKKS